MVMELMEQKMPPMTQTATIGPMAGVALATSDGTMKMPEPITEPTTTQSAATGPSTRGRVVSFGMVSVAMSAVSLPVRNVKGQGEDGQRLGVSRTVGTVVGA